MSNTHYQVTIVSHTHWDREWYRPFQVFRLKLVELVDDLLDLLDRDPDYHSFLLDGQTIILEDYLELRPEREADLRRHIQGGRLFIGPWHILPDEFLVGPEATVRNLMLAARVCERFGARMPIGYTPDSFGHISQLPQILAGCGLQAAVLQRGLADEPAELWWEAPDGTRLLTIFLREGYGNLAWAPTEPDAFTHVVAGLVERLAPHAHTPHLLLLNGTDHMMPQPELPALVAAANARLAERAHIHHGSLPAYVSAVRDALGAGDQLPVVRGEIRSPRRFPVLQSVYSTRMWIKQRNQACETALERYAEPLSAFAQALDGIHPASELWLAWRYLIQNHAHDSICGCSVDQVHEEMRTRFDWSAQIADNLAEAGLRCLAAQVDGTTLPAPPSSPEQNPPDYAVVSSPGDQVILVYNPIPGARAGRVELDVPWPGPGRDYELLDEDGRPVPCHWSTGHEVTSEERTLEREELRTLLDQIRAGFYGGRLIRDARLWINDREAHLELVLPEYHTGEIGNFAGLVHNLRNDPALRRVERCHLVTYLAGQRQLSFVAQDVPGVGYRAYRLHGMASPPAKDATPKPNSPRQGGQHIENEWFTVRADERNGSLTLVDRRTGVTYSGLNRFEDGGDRGDEYNFCPPPQDRLIVEPAQVTGIERVEEGPLGQVLRIRAVYELPARLAPDRLSRAGETVPLPLVTEVRLTPGVPRVDIRTWLENRAEDHRLRVHFSTGIHSDRAIVDGHFDRLVRFPHPVQDTTGWAERPQPTAPQRAFVAVTDGTRGLLVATRGLPEYELIPGAEGATLALTLLRCVGWLSRDDLDCRPGHAGPQIATPGAQCPGPATFAYSLIPFGGGRDLDEAAREAYAFGAPLRGICAAPGNGRLPARLVLLSLEPAELVLTAVKPAERGAGMVLRFFNSSDSPVTGQVRLGLPVESVIACDLLERPLNTDRLLPDQDGTVRVEVPPRRIVTWMVQLK